LSGRAAVLVVDDERDMAESCAYLLGRAGYEVVTAFSGEQALEQMARRPFEVVITDLRMPRMSGLQVLAAIKQQAPDVEVLMITGFPEIQTAVAAIKQGAFDYLTKPYVEKDLMERVEKALAHRQVKEQNQGLKERLRSGQSGRQLVFRSPAFAATVALLEKAARSDASVLIQGESGTGKELLAHRLHDQSARAGRPFVPVDCATVPEALVESELFGHVKGAFTGSVGNKPGLFQVADGGTLFLDEVGELPPAFQPKLLRAIQERHVRPVGSAEQVAIDVRIVCATNRNLQQDVAEGRFRADLFYRLDVVRITVPPLRERPEDVPLLAAHFLDRFKGSAITGMEPEVLEVLSAYPWPGNVRQLRNVLERACALAPGPRIRLQDLPEELLADTTAPVADGPVDPGGGTFQELKARKVAAIESSYVAGLLQKHGGNVTRSAEEAGMTRSAFQKLMQRYGIRSSEYRG
jgi:DNA-binding NtrC family response regulator